MPRCEIGEGSVALGLAMGGEHQARRWRGWGDWASSCGVES